MRDDIFENFDERDLNALLEGSLQRHRPHIFVDKLRERTGAQVVLGKRYRPSRNLTVEEFASAYAAAEFAARFGLYLDTHVTLDFGRLGVEEPTEVQSALSGFTRCYAAWCKERSIPPAWIAAVEMGRDYSYHAHVALFVPGDAGAPRSFRREFRSWAKSYAARRGEHVPRAIRVRAGKEESLLTHWIIFHYLVKGYDRDAVICSDRNAPDGQKIRLGDLIARWYRDPGPVALNRRISISNSLGPARRAFGAPTGLEFMLPQGPNWEGGFDIFGTSPLAAEGRTATPLTVPIRTPFRSTFEDGCFDVRRLYPQCFYEFVTKLPLHSTEPDALTQAPDQSDAYEPAWVLEELNV